jgi:hypothetical protein
MPRRRHLSAEELRQTLREWDPTLGDAQLSAEESREIERRLAVSPFPEKPFSIRRRWPQFALATGGGLLVALVLFVSWEWRPTERASQREPLRSEHGATAMPGARDRDGVTAPAPLPGRAVQLHLVARGGTRIVWVLNPALPSFPDNLEENAHAK